MGRSWHLDPPAFKLFSLSTPSTWAPSHPPAPHLVAIPPNPTFNPSTIPSHQPQVDRLLDVYHGQGPAALESFEVPLLSWDDYQAIKAGGEAAPALPAGESAAAAAKGRLLEGGSEDGSAGAHAHEAKAARVGSAGQASATGMLSPAPSSAAREARGAVLASGGGSQTDEKDFESASEAGSIDVDELCELD